MPKFKVGDKVRALSSTYGAPRYTIGPVSEITHCGKEDNAYRVCRAGESFSYWFDKSDLELVTETKDYSLPNTVVHTTTQAEYDEVMEKYEEIGWTWRMGQAPSAFVAMSAPTTYITVRDGFTADGGNRCAYTILTMAEWREHFGIEPKRSGVVGRLYGVSGPVSDHYVPATTKSTKEKSIMITLRNIPKNIAKILNADTKSLYQTGYINSDLEHTDKAEEALMEILFEAHKVELATLAKKEIKEIKAEAKRSK